MRILKVGDLYLNVDRMSMARDHRHPETRERTGDLLVYFHDDKRARLKGAEAEGVRQFLADNSDPNPPSWPASVDPGPDRDEADP